MYAVPASFATDGFIAGNNYTLSKTDKFLIRQRYPFPLIVKSILYNEEKITSGQYLQSPNGNLKLAMQNDGNLVLHKSSAIALWNFRKNGKPVTQNTGSATLYRNGYKRWSTKY